MTPREFYDLVVKPDLVDFEASFGDIRAAHHAVASADALFAHLFYWLKAHRPGSIIARDDLEFREHLGKSDADLALLRDVAKAQKHVELVRGKPMVRRADQVSVGNTGWGQARWGEARWGGPPQVHVTTDDGDMRALDYLVRHAVAVLDKMLAAEGL
jgi:hypothetical protein